MSDEKLEEQILHTVTLVDNETKTITECTSEYVLIQNDSNSSCYTQRGTVEDINVNSINSIKILPKASVRIKNGNDKTFSIKGTGTIEWVKNDNIRTNGSYSLIQSVVDEGLPASDLFAALKPSSTTFIKTAYRYVVIKNNSNQNVYVSLNSVITMDDEKCIKVLPNDVILYYNSSSGFYIFNSSETSFANVQILALNNKTKSQAYELVNTTNAYFHKTEGGDTPTSDGGNIIGDFIGCFSGTEQQPIMGEFKEEGSE